MIEADLRLGLLGTAFMGRAHSRGIALLNTLEDEPAARVVPIAICGRDPERAEHMRRRFGYARAITDWHELVAAPDIDAIDNAGSNDLHAEPTIAALRAGKHVLCEKPLGRDAQEARRMLDVARQAGRIHMCGFNYRFYPAVRLARTMIEQGAIGEIYQYRSRFLLASGALPNAEETPWRLRRESAGSGVVGDLLAHHIDLARYLVAEPTSVSAVARTWQPERHGVLVDVEDAVIATMEFAGGAIGTLEASRMTPGHILESVIEIDGSRGTLTFDVQAVNELRHSTSAGTTTIHVTEAGHPFIELWWPRGQGLGWADSFVHELRHFVGACAGAWPVAPHGATFEDGYRCAVICDAVIDAAAQGRRIDIPTEEGEQ